MCLSRYNSPLLDNSGYRSPPRVTLRAAGVDTFSVPQSGVKGGEKVYRCGGTGTDDYTLPPEIVNGKGYWVWSDEPSTLVT